MKDLERFAAGATHKSVEAINAGVISYGPDQISLRIENELDQLHPDLVVVAVFSGNDFGDLIRNKIYGLDSAGKLIRRNYHISASLRTEFAPPSRLRLVSVSKKVLDRLLGRNSPIPPGLDDPAKYIEGSLTRCRRDYGDYLKDNEVSNLFKDQYDSDVALTPETEAARYKVRLMDQVLKQIKHSADDKATPLVFLIIPSVTDVCSNYAIKVNPAAFVSYRPSALTDALENGIIEDKIAHLNLFGIFRGGNPCSLYFNFPNGHWNDAGQRLAAQRFSEYLVSSGILK